MVGEVLLASWSQDVPSLAVCLWLTEGTGTGFSCALVRATFERDEDEEKATEDVAMLCSRAGFVAGPRPSRPRSSRTALESCEEREVVAEKSRCPTEWLTVLLPSPVWADCLPRYEGLRRVSDLGISASLEAVNNTRWLEKDRLT